MARAALTRLAAAEAFWRLYGSPKADGTMVYDDVPAASAQAVAWAVATGVIPAVSETSFGAAETVRRADLTAYLYRFDGLPSPLVPVTPADFADGADGWYVPSWGAGTLTASGGTVELVTPGTWISGPGGVDLTGRTDLVLTVAATTGFGALAALQLGPDWTWCETAQAGWAQAAGEIVVDLTTLTPDCQALLGDVKGINLYFNEGTHVLDAVGVR